MVSILFLMSPWTSIHQFESREHPYKKTEVHLISETRAPELTHSVYGFLPHWRGSGTWDLKLDLISHLAWFGVELDSTGEIGEPNGWPADWLWLKEHVQVSGVRFDLAVTCFDWSGKKVHTLLSDTLARTKGINTILSESRECNGVNIDFERPSLDDRDAFAAFVEELADSLHSRGMTLSVDMTAVNWGERFDVARIAKAADYIFIMGYDFHYPGSSEAGPVSPLDGETYCVTNSVDYFVEKSEGHPDRLILGVPYYGYDWPVTDTVPYAKTKGQGTAYIYSTTATRAEQYGRHWHEETSSPWYHYGTTGNLRECWYADTASLALEYQLAREKDFAGIGIWALTYDNGRQELWDLLRRCFTTGVVAEKPHFKGEELLIQPGLVSKSAVKTFLKANPDVLMYDVSGQKLDSPVRGVLFLQAGSRTIKVVVTG